MSKKYTCGQTVMITNTDNQGPHTKAAIDSGGGFCVGGTYEVVEIDISDSTVRLVCGSRYRWVNMKDLEGFVLPKTNKTERKAIAKKVFVAYEALKVEIMIAINHRLEVEICISDDEDQDDWILGVTYQPDTPPLEEY